MGRCPQTTDLRTSVGELHHGFHQGLHTLTPRPRSLQAKLTTYGGSGEQRHGGGELGTSASTGHDGGGRFRTGAKTGLHGGGRFRTATKTRYNGRGRLRTGAKTGYNGR